MVKKSVAIVTSLVFPSAVLAWKIGEKLHTANFLLDSVEHGQVKRLWQVVSTGNGAAAIALVALAVAVAAFKKTQSEERTHGSRHSKALTQRGEKTIVEEREETHKVRIVRSVSSDE